MGDFRVRVADRKRHVELIEAAYADGQLGDADRGLRVSRALTAETRDELASLTRDLRRPAGPPPVRAAARSRSRSRHVAGVLGGLGVFVALVGGGVTALVALFAFAGSVESDSATSERIEAPTPIVSEKAAAVGSFRMTAASVTRFVEAYEEKFGTLDTYGIGFYPTRASVEVPLRGSRSERWSWDGRWTNVSMAGPASRSSERVDLGSLDVRRLVANIDTATRTLRVRRGELSHVIVRHVAAGEPSVDIYVTNTFNETGSLVTTLGGDIVRRERYTP